MAEQTRVKKKKRNWKEKKHLPDGSRVEKGGEGRDCLDAEGWKNGCIYIRCMRSFWDNKCKVTYQLIFS
jgi:hypothetical protein